MPCIRQTAFPAAVKAAWRVAGTPADCVKAALEHLLPVRPDLLFSGINNGYNTGFDIAYSGTVGAILEASVVNIPAVAFSTDFRAIDAAAPQLDDVWDYFTRHRLLEKHTLYNVNIPTVPAKGARITRQGGVYFSDVYREVSPGMYQAVGKPVCERYATLERDIDAVLEGYISVMPLTVDRTDYRVYPELLRTVGI